MLKLIQRIKSAYSIVAVLLLALGIRLPYFVGGVFGGDAEYHARAALTVLKGGRLYVDVPYTYPPLYAYTEALSIALFGDAQMVWKIVPLIYDLGCIIMIYLIARKIFGYRQSVIASLVYGFSPLPLIAVSRYASFDSTASFWMLVSIFFLLEERVIPSALSLGIGVSYKYFPMLLLPMVIMHLPKKRSKITFLLGATVTVALIQLPFIITSFTAWFENVILYHLQRDGGGYTIYQLFATSPQLWDVPQSNLMLLQPLALFAIYFLIMFDKDESSVGLLKKMALVMLIGVFFSKVILFYALWFIPILSTFIATLKTRIKLLTLSSFIILQLTSIVGAYLSESGQFQEILTLSYSYLVATAALIIWLLFDRFHFMANYLKSLKPAVIHEPLSAVASLNSG